MPFSRLAEGFLLILRWGWFREGRFMGRVLDEWIADSQEFIHTKLPRLIVIAIIAFVLSRLLRLITFHMTRVAELHAGRPGRVSASRNARRGYPGHGAGGYRPDCRPAIP